MDASPHTAGVVEAGGATLFYESVGEGEPLVLIHGGLLDQRMWGVQVRAFAQAYRVIRYDVRGHGRSARPPGTYANEQDLAALLDFLGVEQACLVGLSLGARIAINMALEHPGRVKALILAAPGLAGYTFSPEIMEAFAKMSAAAREGDNAQAAELFMRCWTDGPARTPDQVDPAVRERVRAMIVANLAQTPEPRMQLQEPEALSRLAEIRVPTLVILGDQDVPDISRIASLLVRDIAGARQAVVHGAAHMLNMEQPEAFNRLVLEFLVSFAPARG